MGYGTDPTTPPGGYGKDPTEAPDARKRGNVSEEGGDAKGAPASPAAGGSAIGALFRGFLHGMGDVLHGGAQLGARMGPEIGDTTTTPQQSADLTRRVDAAAQQREQQYQASPQRVAHPIASGVGRVAGNVAATAPIAAVPGLGAGVRGASLIPRIASGMAGGAMGATTAPVTAGDYGAGKVKQLAVGAGVGGAIPAAGGALAPALPNVSQFVSSTMQRFPRLARFLQGTEERTVDGFDRSVARQVLEPIGGDVPRNMKAGHGLIDHAYDQIDRAYEEVKPSLSLNQHMGPGAWRTYEPELQRIRGELSSSDWQKSFDTFIRNRITNRFDKNGVMDGDAFKQAEHDLTKRVNQLYGTQNAELGDALSEVRDLFRDSLMKQNPAQAPQLSRINDAYSMFYRMSKAAAGKSAEGKFTPSDLSGAIRQQEKNPHAFARGQAMAGGPALPDHRSVLQAYAALGEKQLKGARIGPMDIMHAFHPASMLPAAGRALMRGGAYPVGRAIKGSAPLTAPLAGRAAASAVSSRDRAGDRMKASRKVGEIQTRLYAAKRRGDLGEVQKLNGDLAEAQADYRKLQPSTP